MDPQHRGLLEEDICSSAKVKRTFTIYVISKLPGGYFGSVSLTKELELQVSGLS